MITLFILVCAAAFLGLAAAYDNLYVCLLSGAVLIGAAFLL